MHTIYLFKHIFAVTAQSDHLVNQDKEQLVFCCAAPFFSKLLRRCSLQICWRANGDHICSWASPSHIVFIGSEKNSPVVKDLANMVANDVACCERWFYLQISITKMTNIVRQRGSLLHLVETNIISFLQHTWRFAILCPSKLSHGKLPHLPIHQTIQPKDTDPQ